MDGTQTQQIETKENIGSKFDIKEYIEKYKMYILVILIILAVGGYFYLNKDKFTSSTKNNISITHSPIDK